MLEGRRNWKISQLQQVNDPEHYVYTEHVSKNRIGGYFLLHVDMYNKEISIFKNPSAGQCYLISLLDLYHSKLQEEAKEADISTVGFLRSSQMMDLGTQHNQGANVC